MESRVRRQAIAWWFAWFAILAFLSFAPLQPAYLGLAQLIAVLALGICTYCVLPTPTFTIRKKPRS